MRRLPASLLALALLAGCGGQAPSGPSSYQSKELGFAFDLPEGWRMFGDEAKSAGGTLINWQVKSLQDAEPTWMAALPGSVVPELQGWTRHYFGAYRDERQESGTVGNEPALILSHTVNVGKQRTPSTVRYWAVRRGEVLYLIRAVYPAGRESEEDPGVRALIASWRFTPPAAPLPA